jgi:metal-sulfur cluster biosynthetic enzyme
MKEEPLSIAEIYEILRTVDDPEVGLNIVDMGFIYEVKTTPEAIDLVVGFTSPACPMADAIVGWIQAALGQATEQEVRIDTDSAPVWTPERMRQER